MSALRSVSFPACGFWGHSCPHFQELRPHPLLITPLRISMIRQGDVERRPTVDGTLRPSPAAMPRHDSPDIGQPDPGAFKIFHSVQPLEDPEQLVGKLHVKTD